MTSVTSSTETMLTGTNTSSVSSETLISSDFDTWMTLLTAQLQNQDPFNPVDSTEYTAQLAQFSSVEQQVRTNDLLENLVTASNAADMATMANWIGKEVRVESDAAFDGDPITLHVSPDPTATSSQLVVRNSNGQEINRLAVASDEVVWNGRDADGKTAPVGTYSFEVESFDVNGDPTVTSAAQAYANVLEVQMADGALNLLLAGGLTVKATDVTSVRAAP
jgi:flagellar basal-body rod modification protein FlgD